jgi:hypothetical protein
MKIKKIARLKLLEAMKVDWSDHKKQELFGVHWYFIFEPYELLPRFRGMPVNCVSETCIITLGK